MEHFTADLHAFYSQTHPFSAHASLVKQTVYHFCLPPKGVISPNCKNHDFKQVSLSSCTLDVNVFGWARSQDAMMQSNVWLQHRATVFTLLFEINQQSVWKLIIFLGHYFFHLTEITAASKNTAQIGHDFSNNFLIFIFILETHWAEGEFCSLHCDLIV